MNKNLSKLLEKYDLNVSMGCVEPGYDDKPVIKGDWNNIPQKVYSALEGMGYACEWSDEWIECDNCYKSFRCSQDSYGWQMFGVILGGFAVCGNCIEWDEYLESLENNPRKALTSALYHDHKNEVESRYELIECGFENGFHEGMNDNPVKILESLRKNDKNGKYIFAMTDQSQFYITFAVFKKRQEEEE